VYLVALPGGWIADRLIGARRAVLAGGLIIMTGNAMLAISTSPAAFYVGLIVIVIGVGLLKPNVSAMVAELYPEGGARLDAGFTLFYIGINIGSALGPLVTGEAQQLFGPRAGFRRGGAIHGLRRAAVLPHARGYLGEAGKHVARTLEPRERQRLWLRLALVVAILAAVLLACVFGLIAVDPVTLAHYTFGLDHRHGGAVFRVFFHRGGSRSGGAPARHRAGCAVSRQRAVLVRL
jgi:proton-dependent oligopeptide transporter, POT family